MDRFPKRLNLIPLKYKKDKRKYTPIHCHSSFSLNDSVSTTIEMVEVAKALGMSAMSISDHGHMSGIYSFVEKCNEENIKPIVGCEFYVNENRLSEKKDTHNQHLCLFAMDQIGYRNLLKILHDAMVNGFYYRARTDLNYVAENSDGLICTTACLGSPIISPLLRDKPKKAKRNLKKLMEIFDDRLYIELQFNELEEQKKANAQLLKWMKEYDLNCVYGLDSHYSFPNDVWVQDIVKLINRKKTLNHSDWKDYTFNARRLFIKSYQDAFNEPENFGYDISKKILLKSLESTNEIADRCNFDIEFGLHPPKFIYNGEIVNNSERFFKLIIEKFLLKKINTGEIPKSKIKIYRDRIDYETKKIVGSGYSDYFLMIWDMIRNVKKKGVYLGVGRGSAAGSLVSYLLGIIIVDPIKHGLLFERFLDIERDDPPDIDLDWEHERGFEVEKYLEETYGKDSVAHVVSHSEWAPKSAISEVFKVLNVDREIIMKTTKFIRMDEFGNRNDKDIEEAIEYVNSECKDLEILDLMERQENRGLQIVKRLVKNVRNFGQHPAGVVVSPKPIHHFIPVYRHKDKILTGYSFGAERTEIEKIGLIKIDVLKMKSVTVVKKIVELIKEKRGVDLSQKIWKLDLKDKKVFDYYSNGKTEGIFQVESDDFTKFLKRLKPDHFEDLVAGVSLFRPGSLSSGETEKFVKRKQGKEEVKYIHPSLKSFVGSTYGCFIYQEQLMTLMNELAGFSKGETLRDMRLLKKSYNVKDPRTEDVVARLRKGLKEKAKFEEHQIDALVYVMHQSYLYIFNKSHALSYAMFSYIMMWLKCHYVTEFFCALLSETENKKLEMKGGRIELKTKKYIEATRRMGIKVLPPKFGKSRNRFVIERDKRIRMGVMIVVGLGKSGAELDKLYEEYSNEKLTFEKMILSKQISFQKLNKRKIETLIKVGFFDRKSAIKKDMTRKQMLKAWSYYGEKKKKSKDLLKIWKESIKEAIEKIDDEFTDVEKMKFQLEHFRFFAGKHPFQDKDFLNQIEKYNNKVKKDGRHKKFLIQRPFELILDGKKYNTVIGYVSELAITKVKRGVWTGESMAIVTLEDDKNKIKLLVWPEFYALYHKKIIQGEILICRIQKKRGDDAGAFELASFTHKAQVVKASKVFDRFEEEDDD